MGLSVMDSPPDTHNERPLPLTELPFNVLTPGTIPRGSSYPVTVLTLQYFAYVNGAKLPYSIVVEDSQYAHPLGKRILDLIELFRCKEAEINGYLKRIDDLETELQLTRGEKAKAENSAAQLRGKRGKES